MEEKIKDEVKNKNDQKKTIIFILIFIVALLVINTMMNFYDESRTINVNVIAGDTAITNEVIVQEEIIPENKVNDKISVTENKVIKVTEETFEKEVLKSDRKVLIDFYADWCGPCKILSPIVEEIAKENPDLKVVKIDVDANENLAYKYQTYSIPTLVVIENGKEVRRAVGAIPKESILELVNNEN